ncbi:MAG: ABC transporter ATP-binding protein [Anaerolineales bacterium]|jgi:branched-chain amino acid transport system ATP-binding protein|nr:ABC transporter ATP-binding protein [Rhodocyclaceae bacterium]MCW5886695.1 ABC transporter ATP-binding protein [Anaerolineales bacterium]
MSASLVFENVDAYYGTSQILHGVSFEVLGGTVTCLLGLNGMGKTTTLRTAMGLVDRQEGRIILDGKELKGATYVRSKMGITLVPEDRKVFAGLTVLENLEVARCKRDQAKDFTIDDAIAIFPRLGERLKQKAGTMSGGEQQMLVVARAMLANPGYMMLDEPTEGLAPEYVDAIKISIDAARSKGIGVILVEQSLPLALAVGDSFNVMQNGQIYKRFTRDEVIRDPTSLANLLVIE